MILVLLVAVLIVYAAAGWGAALLTFIFGGWLGYILWDGDPFDSYDDDIDGRGTT